MKSIFLFLCWFLSCTGLVFSQDYLLTFTGIGETTVVDSVKIENLTHNRSLTIKGTDVLHLTRSTGSPLPVIRDMGARIYPNPVQDIARLEFWVPTAGRVQVSVSDAAGRRMTGNSRLLESGRHLYEIAGFGSGMYLVEVRGEKLHYSLRLTGTTGSGKEGRLSYGYRNDSGEEVQALPVLLKSQSSAIDMEFTDGDRLQCTGYSGTNRTVVVESPSQSKVITFGFVSCRDAAGKDYTVVKIGSQVWMAENLAYLPSVSPSSQGSYTTPYYYVYGYQGADTAVAKAHPNYATYGVLYNWPAALTACPDGWHLPSDAEWTTLENYLITNGYNYDGTTTGNKIAKSMATATGWNSHSGTGTVGNTDYPAYRNKSGFSGLPGGYRNYSGAFFYVGYDGYWWSSTETSTNTAWNRYLYYNSTSVYRGYYDKAYGFSVRCLRDN